MLPIHSVGRRSKRYLVVFAPTRSADEIYRAIVEISPGMTPEEKDRLIAATAARSLFHALYLQSLLEERDVNNQELVSANEEIQSANEELQSTNEELETTKEELQSSNEELHTVNDELQNRNAVLDADKQRSDQPAEQREPARADVEQRSHIRQFTPPAQRVMNLRPSDIGRPVRRIAPQAERGRPDAGVPRGAGYSAPREMEVQDREGRWFLLRVRPYRTADNKIDGVVVALVDIDQLRRTGQELRTARDFARSVIEGVPLPLAVIDFNLQIRATNDAFCELAGLDRADL